ncbi:MAG TPA: redoxin domain-containing protein [bacterium]|nr:redoxin domain-containing protein [bacterium]
MRALAPYLLLTLAITAGFAWTSQRAGLSSADASPAEGAKATEEAGDDTINVGDIPAITGIKGWLNTPEGEPLTAADLEGKVVLVHFWTRGCYNCVNTIPYVNKWYGRFKDDPFVLIGVHTPEFAAEKDRAALEQFLEKHGIAYPVAMDNDMATWDSFRNRYWPADYLFDARGRLVYAHIGEGQYGTMERKIADTLAKPN